MKMENHFHIINQNLSEITKLILCLAVLLYVPLYFGTPQSKLLIAKHTLHVILNPHLLTMI